MPIHDWSRAPAGLFHLLFRHLRQQFIDHRVEPTLFTDIDRPDHFPVVVDHQRRRKHRDLIALACDPLSDAPVA
jgi:hypothetical protein